MRLRGIACLAVGAVVLALQPDAARAELYNTQDFLSGGAPVTRTAPAARNATAARGAPAVASAPAAGFSFPRFSLFNWNTVARTTVEYPNKHRPGTIVVNTAERRLYYIVDNTTAIRYGIGVGREGFTWKGVQTVTMKREWPDWSPPPQMLKRRPDLPRHMVGGPDNPLGARALYLGDTLYRIHGSNEGETIGEAVSSGCFRLTNDDVVDLYNRVKVGATVIVR